jgi:hypothetical protein
MHLAIAKLFSSKLRGGHGRSESPTQSVRRVYTEFPLIIVWTALGFLFR